MQRAPSLRRSSAVGTRLSAHACGCTRETPGVWTAPVSASWPRNGMAASALRRANAPVLLLLALPLLGIARLLPADAFGLWLRLVAATLLLFLPGALIARALRLRGASIAVAWTLAALVPALFVVFLVHTTIWIALAVLGAVALVALPFS